MRLRATVAALAACCATASLPALAAPPPYCAQISEALPGVSVADCQAQLLAPGGGRSVKGAPLLVRRIPAQAGVKGKPVRILLLGGIHGDEPTSSAIVFRWMGKMQTPAARQFSWSIAPVVNPDGMLAKQKTRVNARGVDLNRNFPTPDWQRETERYWNRVTSRDPRRYPGRAALSEPESRWLDEEIRRFQPDLIISIHAPFGLLDFDGPAAPPKRFGLLRYDPIGVYPGSLGNYGGGQRKVPVVTIELPHAQEMPKDAEVDRIWRDMLSWIGRSVSAQKLADARS
jgi:murein peptide amidase A